MKIIDNNEMTEILEEVMSFEESMWDHLHNTGSRPIRKLGTNEWVGTIDYFFSVDNASVDYLQTILSKAEMGVVFVMCNMVKWYEYWNCLYSRKTGAAHTKESLMEEIGMEEAPFKLLIQELVNNSVIYVLDGEVNGMNVVRYILNPTLARKDGLFAKKCVSLFEDLREKAPLGFPKIVGIEQVLIKQ
jgi:hypothetical protein